MRSVHKPVFLFPYLKTEYVLYDQNVEFKITISRMCRCNKGLKCTNKLITKTGVDHVDLRARLKNGVTLKDFDRKKNPIQDFIRYVIGI